MTFLTIYTVLYKHLSITILHLHFLLPSLSLWSSSKICLLLFPRQFKKSNIGMADKKKHVTCVSESGLFLLT